MDRQREAGPTPAGRIDAARARPWATRKGVVGVAALGLAAGGLAGIPAFALNSDPPSGPGNVEIFPERDMVAIEGYAEKAGQQATIRVLRDGREIGTARGTVDDTGFLEVNHPGGVCWTGVTPNITGHDEIRVDFADASWDGATTGTAVITRVERVPLSGAFPFGVRVSGTYGADVDVPGDTGDLLTDPGMFGVEIVNPDMREPGSGIGSRAIGWPSDDVPTGYSVEGSAGGGSFTVTYGAATESDQDLMLEGDPVVSSWQAEPEGGAEAQLGITLYELKEIDGPGFGGCPAGPEEMEPDSPTSGRATGAGDGVIDVAWDPGSTAPEAPATAEYRVRAVLDGDEVGKRLPVEARSHQFTGLRVGKLYDLEVTAVSTAGESFPPLTLQARAAAHVAPTATAVTTAAKDDTSGVYTELLVGDKGVVFESDDLLDRVHYTTDGSTPTGQSRSWAPGMSPVDLRADTTLKFFAVDKGNNPGPVDEAVFDLEVDGAPAVPTDVQAVPVDRGATVSWAEVTENVPTSHDVLVYEPAAEGGQPTLLRTIDEATTTTADGRVSTSVTGLTAGASYQFAVTAENANGVSNPSPLSAAITIPAEAARAEAGADQTTRRGSSVTLDGTTSVGATSYTWTQVPDPADPDVYGDVADPTVTLEEVAPGKVAFTFPLFPEPVASAGTVPTSEPPLADHALEFELAIETASGVETDRVLVQAQPDIIQISQARWRAGDELRLSGTGSVPGAVLTIRDEWHSGTRIGQTTVDAAGDWSLPRTDTTLSDGRVYIHSDRGAQLEVQTSR